MKYIDKKVSIVASCHEILDMNTELQFLRWENKELKKTENDYNKLLHNSIKHNNEMMKNLLIATLKAGE